MRRSFYVEWQHYSLIESLRRTGRRRPDIQDQPVAQSVICCCMTDNVTLGSLCFGGCRTPFMRGGETAVSGSQSGDYRFREHAAAAPPNFALQPGQALSADIYGSVKRGVRGDRFVALGGREDRKSVV